MSKRITNQTLDTQHSKKLSQFQDQQHNIKTQQKKLDAVTDQLSKLTRCALSNLTDDQFNTYVSLTDQQVALQSNIEQLEKAAHEIDYYIDNADIIFKYYDIVENGNVTENETAATITEHSILKFFQPAKPEPEPEAPPKEPDVVLQDEDRASLLDRYMQHTDKNYIRSLSCQECEICPNCESTCRTMLVNDGFVLCNECYTIETVIVDHERPSYRDPPKEIEHKRSQKLLLVVYIFK